uniref:Uncharacterized protein n=1 Tax=Anguilla anguilla TaxID=7936 RepID=A0A0E9W7M0_ANGAN
MEVILYLIFKKPAQSITTEILIMIHKIVILSRRLCLLSFPIILGSAKVALFPVVPRCFKNELFSLLPQPPPPKKKTKQKKSDPPPTPHSPLQKRAMDALQA